MGTANRSTWLWVGVAVVLALVALPLFGMFMHGGGMMGGAWGPMMGGMMGGGGLPMHRFGGWGGGWLWLGMAVRVLLFGGLIALVYSLVRRSAGYARPEAEELQILRLRLARGEITPEVYDALRQKLQQP
jgi:putative membrane protein